jgi:hypothetical protein
MKANIEDYITEVPPGFRRDPYTDVSKTSLLKCITRALSDTRSELKREVSWTVFWSVWFYMIRNISNPDIYVQISTGFPDPDKPWAYINEVDVPPHRNQLVVRVKEWGWGKARAARVGNLDTGADVHFLCRCAFLVSTSISHYNIHVYCI